MPEPSPRTRHVLAFAAVALTAAALVAGCGERKPQAGGMMGFPPAEVTTEVVQPASYPVAFEYVGQAIGSKDAEVRPRVTGILEKRLYQEGAIVKAGQPLFLIDPRPYEAQLASAEAELARAEAERSRAEREVARLRPLAEKRAIGQKEADDAQSQAELAAAAIKAAQARLTEAKLNVSYTRVLAPISGVTGRAQQSEGSLAAANTTLLTTISQLDPIWIAFSISENERLKLDRARAAGTLTLPDNNAFAVELKLADGSRFPRPGRVDFADLRVNPQTGTLEMRATVPNGDRALKPGQFVRVVLKGAERRNAIAVPQVAVMDGPQGKFVYVVGKNEKGADVAQPRPVVVGDWTNGDTSNRWIVDSGLKAGDVIVVDGMARVMPGAPIRLAGAPPAPGAASPNPAAPADGAPPKPAAEPKK
jgi:membrane fusion protein (multidrug efflux system)